MIRSAPSGNEPIPGFGEMRVQRERLAHIQEAHALQADAIHETELPAVLAQQPLDALPMQIRLDPPNRQQRNDALEEIARRCETDAMLQERRRFDEDVRGRVQCASGLQQSLERGHAVRMAFFGLDQQRVQGRGVGEHAHDR